MGAKFFTFVLASLFMVSCGTSQSGDDNPDIGPAEGAGGEAGTTGTAAGDDAGPTSNSAVVERPLMKSCYKGDSFVCSVEATIFLETNRLRGGRRPFIQDFESSYVAREWSAQQARVGTISHDGFPYERRKVLVAEFPNARWEFGAENVAMISSRETDPNSVGKKFVEMWKNSKGHLENILSERVYLGVGVYRVGNSIYATQIFH